MVFDNRRAARSRRAKLGHTRRIGLFGRSGQHRAYRKPRKNVRRRSGIW